MDIDKIKQRILDLAIRGKLVSQDPNDEPASVLIEKIKAEKEKMIKEGKLKPSKDDSYIYKASDNCYYENPFEILPNNWLLCRFGSIVNIRRGASPRPIKSHLTNSNDGINWIKIGDALPDDIYISYTAQKIKKESCKYSVFLKKGALILSNSMSFGRPYILNVDGCIHDGWLSIETYKNTIDVEFLQSILQGYMWYFKSKASGSGVDNLNIDKVKDMPFALPPIEEQKRIVKKIKIIDDVLKKIKQSEKQLYGYINFLKQKVLAHFFGDNSSYKSYYPNYQIQDLCKLDKNDVLEQGLHPYLEAKVIRGKKTPEYIKKGSFIRKGTKIILVDGENSGEVMIAPYDGYLGSTFRILNANEKIKDEYLMWFIEYYKKSLKSNRTGSAVPHLNKKIFYELKIPLPPINIQEDVVSKIANFFNQLDIIIS